MSDERKDLEKRFFIYPQTTVCVKDFEAEGHILDIGGGGEGIIGKLKPDQVVAIDLRKRELEEAGPGPLQIIMDARDLQFLDGSFRNVTAFYSLMYVRSNSDQQQVFHEIARVLKPGGRFLCWDVRASTQPEGESREMYLVFLRIQYAAGREVNTGYAQPWPETTRDAEHYTRLAQTAGLQLVSTERQEHLFFLQFEKPAA